MKRILFAPIFSLFMILQGCTIERAVEHVVAEHANGAKKTSFWIYPDGTILKRNEWYTDGIKEYEIPYKDSVPHGEFKRWDGYGDLSTVGEYKQGKRSGTWTSYYAGTVNSRKKQAVRYYKDDHPVGDWKGWYLDDKLAFEEHYNDNGDSVGIWKKWNPDGTIAEENSCFRTSESGYYKKFDNHGFLESEYSCKNGSMHGTRLEYYSDGKKIRLKENWTTEEGRTKLDGKRTFYYANGQVQKIEFWDHLNDRTGVWQWFSPEGELIVKSSIPTSCNNAGDPSCIIGFWTTERTDYGVCGRVQSDNSIKHIVCAETTSVRTLSKGRHPMGTLWYFKEGHDLRFEEDWDGHLKASRSFYPDTIKKDNGDTVVYTRLASEGFWEKQQFFGSSKRHGIWRNWYRNGVLKDSLTYVNGERVGEQFGYDSTGKQTIHKTENGKNRPVIMHILGTN